jgi:hypothetical protein
VKLLNVQVGDRFNSFGDGVLNYLESTYVGAYDNVSLDWDAQEVIGRKVKIVANVYDQDEEKLEAVVFVCDVLQETWEVTEVIEQRTL